MQSGPARSTLHAYSSVTAAALADDRGLLPLRNWLKKNSVDDSWGTTTQLPTYPSTQGYDSFDEVVLDHQNELMQHYGIVPLFSWWGPDGEGGRAYGGDNFLRAWLARDRVQGGLLYEAGSRLRWNKWGRIDFDWTHNQERFIQDIEYLSGTFFSRHPERFYTIDDRPVIFRGSTRASRSGSPCSSPSMTPWWRRGGATPSSSAP